MRYVVALYFLFSFDIAVKAEDWKPPANPDPTTILNEAREDARQGQYENALAKHVWYHQNAVSINGALTGVRISFALADWQRLGEKYPPALVKLKSVRDENEKQVLGEQGNWEMFMDLSAINRVLDEFEKTEHVFEQLDAKNPKLAAQVFDQAKPALLETKSYKLFMKYVDPSADYQRIANFYDMMKRMDAGGRFAKEQAEFRDKRFANDVAILVAVLTINGKKGDAETIAVTAKQKLDDPDFHESLISALNGIVPDPWP